MLPVPHVPVHVQVVMGWAINVGYKDMHSGTDGTWGWPGCSINFCRRKEMIPSSRARENLSLLTPCCSVPGRHRWETWEEKGGEFNFLFILLEDSLIPKAHSLNLANPCSPFAAALSPGRWPGCLLKLPPLFTSGDTEGLLSPSPHSWKWASSFFKRAQGIVSF